MYTLLSVDGNYSLITNTWFHFVVNLFGTKVKKGNDFVLHCVVEDSGKTARKLKRDGLGV